MSKKVFSAAIAHCKFPEGTTAESAWDFISGQFTGKGSNIENFLNASDIKRIGLKSEKRAVEIGDIFEYQAYNHSGTRTGHVIITDWVPGRSLAYNDIYSKGDGKDLDESHIADNRMEFALEENEGRTILIINRREKGDISFMQSLSLEFKNSSMEHLAYLLPKSSVTPIGKTALKVKAHGFDAAIIQRDDDNRLEF